MKNLMIAAGLILSLLSCNEQAAKHESHTDMDSATHGDMDHARGTGGSEMEKLMGTMMTNMHQQQPTGNNDIDYANMMQKHHQGAVDMANLQLSKGKDSSLKTFSRKVIETQQKEIDLMKEFIAGSQATASSTSGSFIKAMDKSMKDMMKAGTKVHHDIDKDFVAQMIPHHQSAVDMAKAYLEFGSNDLLKKMSRDIIASQEAEIEWLKRQ